MFQFSCFHSKFFDWFIKTCISLKTFNFFIFRQTVLQKFEFYLQNVHFQCFVHNSQCFIHFFSIFKTCSCVNAFETLNYFNLMDFNVFERLKTSNLMDFNVFVMFLSLFYYIIQCFENFK